MGTGGLGWKIYSLYERYGVMLGVGGEGALGESLDCRVPEI